MNAAAEMMSKDYPNRKKGPVKSNPAPKETASADEAPGEEEQEDFKEEAREESQSNDKPGKENQKHFTDKKKPAISNGAKESKPALLKAKLPTSGHFKG